LCVSGLAPSSGLFVESVRLVLSSHVAEDRLRPQIDAYLGKVEVGIYSVLAALLLLTALATMVSAARLLWEAVSHSSIAAQTLRVLDELLVALMLVEILDNVRISIRSHVLVTEPVLVIGLIASIRRMLVISLELAPSPNQAHGRLRAGAGFFRASMIELGQLGLLVLALVFSIALLRRYPIVAREVQA